MPDENLPIKPGADGGAKAPGLAGVVEHLVEELVIDVGEAMVGEIKQQEKEREDHHQWAIDLNADRVEALAAEEDAAFELPDVDNF